MDLGVWMSPGVWRHKRREGGRTQAWNLAQWPEGLLDARGGARLYVAIEGHWRGYFRLRALNWNPADRRCPFTLLFDPRSWTPIDPQPAPPRPRRRFTTEVPPREHAGGNETHPLRERGGRTRPTNETLNEIR